MGKVKNKAGSWYLLRTKQHKELLVRQILLTRAVETFLPFLRTSRNHWGRIEETIEPLFPGYVFAFFDLEMNYYTVQWTPGVVGLVCAGNDPAEIDPRIVDEIKERTNEGVATLLPNVFQPGDRVNVAEGPLRGVAAVFERYMSGHERAALLVELVSGAILRAIAPTSRITPTSS